MWTKIEWCSEGGGRSGSLERAAKMGIKRHQAYRDLFGDCKIAVVTDADSRRYASARHNCNHCSAQPH